MAKKKKGSSSNRSQKKKLPDAVLDDSSGPEDGAPDMIYDEVDQFYENEDQDLQKRLKRKGNKKKNDDNEVFGLDSDIADSDEDVDDVDAIRQWGKKKKSFYGGNPNLPKYKEDEELDENEAEEQEAKMLQIKQLDQMDDEDFFAEFETEEPKEKSSKKKVSKLEATKESIKLDVSKLSKKEKLALFKQESPEFVGIINDFEVKLTEANEVLKPIVNLINEGQIPDGPAAEYVKTKYQIILNYCTNISCYVMFKTRRIPLKFHPMTGRLVQYKQLLDQIAPLDEVVMPQVKSILKKLEAGKNIRDLVKKEKKKAKPPPKRLRILADAEENGDEVEEEDMNNMNTDLTADERMALEIYGAMKKKKATKDSSEDEEPEEPPKPAVDDEETEDDRRGITYQMAKNKGLAPKRSKLQRNPRVKNRMKFDKAKVRRKGQVREVRKELKKYSGELFGINARVKKGVKLQ